LKYEWTEHAERAAIFDAARQGVSTDGLTLVCGWVACCDCGRAIVHSGIKRVVGHHHPAMDEMPHWASSIATADQMFLEAGVEVIRIKSHLGVKILFGGKIIEV
jgi:dCMP deaminase